MDNSMYSVVFLIIITCYIERILMNVCRRRPKYLNQSAPKARESSIEAPKARVMVRGDPSPSRLGGLGSVVSSPSAVPTENAFWRILKATERRYFEFVIVSCHIWGARLMFFFGGGCNCPRPLPAPM